MGNVVGKRSERKNFQILTHRYAQSSMQAIVSLIIVAHAQTVCSTVTGAHCHSVSVIAKCNYCRYEKKVTVIGRDVPKLRRAFSQIKKICCTAPSGDDGGNNHYRQRRTPGCPTEQAHRYTVTDVHTDYTLLTFSGYSYYLVCPLTCYTC